MVVGPAKRVARAELLVNVTHDIVRKLGSVEPEPRVNDIERAVVVDVLSRNELEMRAAESSTVIGNDRLVDGGFTFLAAQNPITDQHLASEIRNSYCEGLVPQIGLERRDLNVPIERMQLHEGILQRLDDLRIVGG